jgi:hypothetical protein
MDLTALSGTVVVDRLLVLENAAAHAHAVAAVAEHLAWRARQEADSAQALLSSAKIFLALLPAGTSLELRAPKPASPSPAELLGVRPHLPRPEMPSPLPPIPHHHRCSETGGHSGPPSSESTRAQAALAPPSEAAPTPRRLFD